MEAAVRGSDLDLDPDCKRSERFPAGLSLNSEELESSFWAVEVDVVETTDGADVDDVVCDAAAAVAVEAVSASISH